MAVRIGLIHSVLPAITAVESMFEKHWPEAERTSIYDQSLYIDLNSDRTMPPKVMLRVKNLVKHCVAADADAILCTGSLFGEAIEIARKEVDIPVLTSFEALVETAFMAGNRFALIATDPGTNRLLGRDLQRYAKKNNKPNPQTEAVFVESAMTLISTGDQKGHDALVVNAAAKTKDCDAILLGQFSMGPTKPLIEDQARTPVLDAPESAVLKLKKIFENKN
ncbi:MAG: aspartate/glutamate racemase family protein [Pseudomonadota bacterium]|nr:aspartate/glutamate racemase family protein [Pseudomonadota bacterium]